MYVLVDKKSGGVYAVRDDGIDERVVQIFEDQDDAERYHGYLIADDYKRKLEVLEVEEEVVKRTATSSDIITRSSDQMICIPTKGFRLV